MGMIRKVKQKLRIDRWQVARTIWPYEEGWGVHNPHRMMVMETGLATREQAQVIADEMNERGG
jgi:hypothetical protein